MSFFQFKPISIGLVIALAGFGALASEPDVFAKLDADKDGRLSRTELQVPCDREIFATLDRNGDRVIERQEFNTSGDMATYEDKGGIDDKGVKLRWLEFRVGRFDLQDGTFVTCNATEGQYPLEVTASRADVEQAKQTIQSRLAEDAMRNSKR
ncbi:EF-hand domain-containing protein [Aquidulcibacter sp.]|uniref:EF-hand domain-containing protein n=1 Tax=Aquidulcibacter sp. TaxID=2052990 RepID=UPI0025C333A7|nr:EF-hand domain-containing protein [Aquidulcibacter sp.]MCA3697614.1 EF-hand domain-containing protein [Aquidulcibacter sp.]